MTSGTAGGIHGGTSGGTGRGTNSGRAGGAPTKRAALLAGAVAAGLAEVLLAHRSALRDGILDHRYGLLGVIGAWWVAYALAAWCVLRLPLRTALAVVLLLTVVLRVAALSPKAPLSDDLYRYAWDGVVQASGTDPYRYPPVAEQLRGLREDWLWPPDRAGKTPETQINRPGVPTIYPPVAEAWFTALHLLVPLSARDLGYERAGLVLDLGVVAALLALLRRLRRDPRWVALYALAPLPALEAVQNAHVDTLGVLFALGAVALSVRGRRVLAGVAVALAGLVKVYPLLLLPLLLRGRGRRVRTVAVVAAVGLLAYLPHVLAVGTRIAGYLPGYLQEEKYDAGTRYLLVGLTGLSGAAATVVVALALLALLGWLVRSDLALPEAAVRLLVGLFLLATPVQPWYALLLLACAALAGAWWAVPVAAAAYPLLFASVLGGPAVAYGRLSYGAAALVVLAAWVTARVRGRSAPRGASPGRSGGAP